MAITYQVQADERLFERWRLLTQRIEPLSLRGRSIVQNDIELLHLEFVQWVDDVRRLKRTLDGEFEVLLADTVLHITKG